jgi:hypothetical protein
LSVPSRLPSKVSCFPSGDQTGVTLTPFDVSSVVLPLATSRTTIWGLPPAASASRLNAILVPSGDQAGEVSAATGSATKERCSAPSGVIR